MASTNVYIVVRDCTYNSAKVLDEADMATFVGLLNTALDAVSNLTFTHIETQSKRDDDTPGS